MAVLASQVTLLFSIVFLVFIQMSYRSRLKQSTKVAKVLMIIDRLEQLRRQNVYLSTATFLSLSLPVNYV